MLEPQSTVLFVLLVLMFGGLMWWLAVTRRIIFRVLAGCLAFIVATWFGILVVNKYFGYYQTWGAAVADLTNPAPNSGPQVSSGRLLVGLHHDAFGVHNVYLRLAVQQGDLLSLKIPGPRSHITRTVYVFLPPQYFQPAYTHYTFPVIELIPGQPGEPQDWINVVGIQVTLDRMVSTGQAKPVILVMPDANGGPTISLQCLNQVGGPQDMTYLAQDVPDAIAKMPRVQPPGLGWGIAGYSEGGFCAANMALRYRYRYGYAAAMSGYFSPMLNKLANPARTVSPFGKNKALRLANTPLYEVRNLAPGARLPLFWLGAGSGDKVDVDNAEYFAQELQLHEANVPVDITPGGGHTMATWHAEVPPMLAWMTTGLTQSVQQAAAKKAAAARHVRLHRAKHRAAKKPSAGSSAPAKPKSSTSAKP